MIGKPDVIGVEQLLVFMREMIASWDSRDDEPYSVSAERGADNARLIYGFTAHTVDLARAVAALHEAGLGATALRLVRGAMECAITAVWLAHRPAQTTRLLYTNTLDTRTIIEEAIRFGRASDDDIEGIFRDTVAEIERVERETPRVLKLSIRDRFTGLAGGEEYYLEYRQASMFCHPSGALAAEYVQVVPASSEFPAGLGIGPREGSALSTEAWLGHMACMVVIAQVAYESTLTDQSRMDYLTTQAERVGISGRIPMMPTKRERVNAKGVSGVTG